jgi:hypothetical protein
MSNERKKTHRHVCVLCHAMQQDIAAPHAHSHAYLVIADGPLAELVAMKEREDFLQRAIFLAGLTPERIRALQPAVKVGSTPRYRTIAQRDAFALHCVMCIAIERGIAQAHDHSHGYMVMGTGPAAEHVTAEERVEFIQYAIYYAGLTPDRIRSLRARAIQQTTMTIPLVLGGRKKTYKSIRLEMWGKPATIPPGKPGG